MIQTTKQILDKLIESDIDYYSTCVERNRGFGNDAKIYKIYFKDNNIDYKIIIYFDEVIGFSDNYYNRIKWELDLGSIIVVDLTEENDILEFKLKCNTLLSKCQEYTSKSFKALFNEADKDFKEEEID